MLIANCSGDCHGLLTVLFLLLLLRYNADCQNIPVLVLFIIIVYVTDVLVNTDFYW